MRKFHADNERIKRRYFHYLREAKRCDVKTVDKAASAILRFEESTGFKAFRDFHIEQAVQFKNKLTASKSPQTGKPLSKATISGTLRNVKAFFIWLAGQTGFRSRVSYSDAEYFNLPKADERIARANREKPTPTRAQIRHAFDNMSSCTDIDRRDRAIFAFIILTGARDGAVASLRLKHLDLIENVVHFDAREVKTKAAKTFSTWFFPVDSVYKECLAEWVRHLRDDQLFGNDDPLFPKTQIALGTGGAFEAIGVCREKWSSAAPIRKIFKRAFEEACLPVFGPHSFRRTLALFGEEICLTPEQFKAWSQNLGHEDVLTTFNSYGNIQPRRQAEIIRGLAETPVT